MEFLSVEKHYIIIGLHAKVILSYMMKECEFYGFEGKST